MRKGIIHLFRSYRGPRLSLYQQLCQTAQFAIAPITQLSAAKRAPAEAQNVTPREQEEYKALRATIRERGTARPWVALCGFVAWAALTTATAALAAPPVASIVPLLVLASAFECVFALHIGVERVGRYLQVFYEDRWEQTAMAFGRPAGAVGLDPLFSIPFLVAVLINMMPALIQGPTTQELVFVAGAHGLFVVRVVAARAAAGKQREIELRRFQELSAQQQSQAPTSHPPSSSTAR